MAPGAPLRDEVAPLPHTPRRRWLRPYVSRDHRLHLTARRALAARKAARHVAIGLTLASGGLTAIAEGHHASWLDVVAIASGLLLFGAFVIEMRRSRSAAAHRAHGVGWVDIFAAAVTAVEAAHLQHKGKVGLPIAYGLLAVLLLTFGLMHERLHGLRRLVVDAQGFDIRTAPWSRLRLAWAEVADLRTVEQVVTVIGHDGRTHRLDLHDAVGGEAVIAALERHAATALAPPPPPPVLPAPDGPSEAAPDPVATPS